MSPKFKGFRPRKKDKAQRPIEHCLKALAISFKDTHALPGWVDITLGYRGFNFLFEVKTEGEKQVRKGSKGEALLYDWQGTIHVVQDIWQVLAVISYEGPPSDRLLVESVLAGLKEK